MNHLWGIDLGGTKIELAVLQKEDKRLIYRNRCSTDSEKGAQHIYTQIHQLIATAANELNIKPQIIGIGTPGVIDPKNGLMKNSNTSCLNGRSIEAELESDVSYQFIFANDANCFAIAETIMGIVPDHFDTTQITFGVILGTGVGGGLVIKDQVHVGQHGIAGEWGHNYLDDSGGACYCGKVGCVETIISGPALERFYQEQTAEKKSLKEIAIVARDQSDPIAVKTIERLLHYFGKSIASLINIIDPDAIIIGGGVGNIDKIYEDIEAAVMPYLFNSYLNTKFLKPKLGDSAGVYGAALLTLNH